MEQCVCVRVCSAVRTGAGGFCREKAGCGAVHAFEGRGCSQAGEDRPWQSVCVHVCLWAGGVFCGERGRAMSSVCVCVCPTAGGFCGEREGCGQCVCVPMGRGFLWGEGSDSLLPGQQGAGWRQHSDLSGVRTPPCASAPQRGRFLKQAQGQVVSKTGLMCIYAAFRDWGAAVMGGQADFGAGTSAQRWWVTNASPRTQGPAPLDPHRDDSVAPLEHVLINLIPLDLSKARLDCSWGHQDTQPLAEDSSSMTRSLPEPP